MDSNTSSFLLNSASVNAVYEALLLGLWRKSSAPHFTPKDVFKGQHLESGLNEVLHQMEWSCPEIDLPVYCQFFIVVNISKTSFCNTAILHDLFIVQVIKYPCWTLRFKIFCLVLIDIFHYRNTAAINKFSFMDIINIPWTEEISYFSLRVTYRVLFCLYFLNASLFVVWVHPTQCAYTSDSCECQWLAAFWLCFQLTP